MEGEIISSIRNFNDYGSFACHRARSHSCLDPKVKTDVLFLISNSYQNIFATKIDLIRVNTGKKRGSNWLGIIG